MDEATLLKEGRNLRIHQRKGRDILTIYKLNILYDKRNPETKSKSEQLIRKYISVGLTDEI